MKWKAKEILKNLNLIFLERINLISNRDILVNIFTRICNATTLNELIDSYRQMLNKSPSFSVYHLEKVQRFINVIYSSRDTPYYYIEGEGENPGDWKLDEEKEKAYKERLNTNFYFVGLFKKLLRNLYTYSTKRMNYIKVDEEAWQSSGVNRK